MYREVVHIYSVNCRMIVTFDEWLRAFFVEDTRSRNIAPDLESRLFRKLQILCQHRAIA